MPARKNIIVFSSTRRRRFPLIFAGLGAVLFAAAVPAAAAACDPFPSDPYVGAVSHERVIAYVDRQFAGDWSRYIQLQAERIRRIDALAQAGKALPVRYGGERVDLTGSDLNHYIALARKRLRVLRCLSRRPDAAVEASAANFNDFATAAGGTQVAVMPKTAPAAVPEPTVPETPAPQQVRLQLRSLVANPPAPPHDLVITASCDGTGALVKVANLGAPFPASGNITVFRLDADNQVVNTRRVQLGAKQVSSFKVKRQPGVTERYGVFIDPSWYFRGRTVDAALTCG
tara:strand:- start:86758 stop:87618 length:861 start_codon:yes stop_codon:yes gene_type:complete